MNVLVVLAHPKPHSFNKAIAETAAARLRDYGHDVVFHDLYAEQFDPILPWKEIAATAELPPVIARHCDELAAADGIVIVHPNWWGQPPAVLKGWVDRVIRPKIAYEFIEGDSGEGVPVGLLKARTALVFNTSNTPPDREQAAFGDPLQALWKNCIFDLCGVPTFYRRMFTVLVTSTPEQRAQWLREVEQTVDDFFREDNAGDGG
jgi:putative NADPH-quinone reductase